MDRASAGGATHLGLVYYFYPNANCTVPTCQLDVGFAASRNGGASWSPHEMLAGPMMLSWLPNTSQGFMVGDYFSTSIPPASSVAVPVFMVAGLPTGSTLHQPTFAVREDIAGGAAASGEIATRDEPTVGLADVAKSAGALTETPRLTLTLR